MTASGLGKIPPGSLNRLEKERQIKTNAERPKQISCCPVRCGYVLDFFLDESESPANPDESSTSGFELIDQYSWIVFTIFARISKSVGFTMYVFAPDSYAWEMSLSWSEEER